MLQVTNVSEFRKNMKKYIDGVAESNNKVIVNSNGKSVVLISLDEYNAMDETDYLLSTDANKERLGYSLDSFWKKNGSEQKLIEM
jgi:antitoxin YefM